MSNLHFLVLDEVDRLLDPTFRQELFIIAENLTSDRQCLLFSATLSKLVIHLCSDPFSNLLRFIALFLEFMASLHL